MDRYPIKTSRPDLMGTELTALISALSSQNLTKVKARTFLDWLQNEMVEHEPNRPLEPMLILVPAPRALDLAFPFAVVEGKAYSTGKQIFEAENQAAVSGACGLKIQTDLVAWSIAQQLPPLCPPLLLTPIPRSSSPSPPKAPSTSSGCTGPSLKTVCVCSNRSSWTVAMCCCSTAGKTL